MSCLEVDVPIGQAEPGDPGGGGGRWTPLEPYGAGNARPVFCLRGATLDRLQNVGQNRHLKLRLSQGQRPV